jgi:4-hydroxy-tetrahydrodipicolinate reductase
MVNGLPGDMAATIAGHAMADPRFEVVPYSLTGPEIADTACRIKDQAICLVKPDQALAMIGNIKTEFSPFISIDFTHPSAVNTNADFYCRHDLPFVMGTTGGDRDRLFQRVCDSHISAVIAPNMAKQIVGFQAMMEWAAQTFPGLFEGYTLEIRESHQKGKADTSGTAKAMVGYFNQLGTPYTADQIQKERDPEKQQMTLGVPKPYLSGHAWHTYGLTSADHTVKFEFSHNVNGRDIYALGTLDAAGYLATKLKQGSKSVVYSMIDVLKNR